MLPQMSQYQALQQKATCILNTGFCSFHIVITKSWVIAMINSAFIHEIAVDSFHLSKYLDKKGGFKANCLMNV